MALFEVWAPKAQKMQLWLGPKNLVTMQAGERGWWRVEVPEAGPGTDYGFCIDGEGPFPDPRSHYQPDGVHGLSRLVNLGDFSWTDQTFQARPLASGVIYELHVGTFTPEGTFESIIPKLDYLRDLGITHIELMPVNEFPGDYGWGYDGVDIYAPEHAYGGPHGLMRLVDACHASGMGVILDVVYNHVGPAGNYLDRFGPYHSPMHNTAWGPAMNYDGPESDEVRKFYLDNARMWLADYHFDGLRLDAVHAIVDSGATHFLEELVESVRDLGIDLGRHLFLIAESDLNDPRIVRSDQLGGYGIDAQWSDDFHHALHVLLTGEQSGYYIDFTAWDDLQKALTEVYVYDGDYSTLRRRRHGRPVGDLSGGHFLAYIQNHDQIGNRAQGERIGHLVGERLANVAAAIVLTSPYVPMLFMGEEWNASSPFQYFTDHEEELGRAVSEGRKNEFAAFGWAPEDVPDPQHEETFRHSRLDWQELNQESHAAMLAWYRDLIHLRRSSPWLLDSRLRGIQLRYDPLKEWLLIFRGPMTIACNLSTRQQEVVTHHNGATQILASDPEAHLTDLGAFLPPQSVLIFIKPSR